MTSASRDVWSPVEPSLRHRNFDKFEIKGFYGLRRKKENTGDKEQTNKRTDKENTCWDRFWFMSSALLLFPPTHFFFLSFWAQHAWFQHVRFSNNWNVPYAINYQHIFLFSLYIKFHEIFNKTISTNRVFQWDQSIILDISLLTVFTHSIKMWSTFPLTKVALKLPIWHQA